MSNTVKLRECPFCGGKAEIRSRYIGFGSIGLGERDEYYVKCNDCRSQADEYRGKRAAAAAWNRRAYDAEIATLRKENAHLENILGHRDDYIKRIGEQRRAAAHVINTIDRQLSTLGISLREAIDNVLKLIRRWRDEEPPRTNFDALTENPERLAEVLIKHDFDGYCPELPECVEGIEDGDYPTDECKQCLVDWLNGAVGE